MSSSPFPFLGPLMPTPGSNSNVSGDGSGRSGKIDQKDISPGGLLNDWKYLLSGDWIGAGIKDFEENYLPGIMERMSELELGSLGDLFRNDNSASPVSGSPLNPQTFEYLNAELSKFYGMDRNTAYQEALANTAYQRAVKDMQAAGLNPASIFGAGRGSTAGGVAYVGSASSLFGSGSASKTQLFDSDTFGMFSSLGGLAAVAVTKNPANFWLGQQSAQAIMKTLNVLDSKYGK